MMRGDLVTVAMQGDFGKPRPALVVQANQFSEHSSVTVLPVTSTLVAAPLLRVTVQPSAENGLLKPSQVMVDKAMTVKLDKVGLTFGRIGVDPVPWTFGGLILKPFRVLHRHAGGHFRQHQTMLRGSFQNSGVRDSPDRCDVAWGCTSLQSR